MRFSPKTIERWRYTARDQQDPIKALERKVPKHAGTFPSSINDVVVAAEICGLRPDHPRWTFQLVHDNLVAITDDKPTLLPLPGYASVCRFMRHHGLGKARRPRRHELEPGFVARERRSFEVRHTHALWHCDLHDGSRNVLVGGERLLQKRLDGHRDVVVGIVEHPQSRVSDFYREVGDIFGVPLQAHNRFAGFKALRTRWLEHISTTCSRPVLVLVLDEAQEVINSVFGEIRVLASKYLDSRQLLCVVFAGDQRLPERFRTPDLLPLGSRIRRRLVLEWASRDELLACLEHLLQTAGHPSLMTEELKFTLVEHAVGNYSILMNLCDELLAVGADRDLPRLDEKL